MPSTTLVFVASDIDRGRRFTKRLLAQAQEVAFGGLSAGPSNRGAATAEATQLVKQEMARAGTTIDPKALDLLVERAGGEITKLRGDIERLLLYAGGRKRITREDVAEVVSADVTANDPWGVVNAIADGDAGRALREAGRRLDRGESPHGLVGQLRWWVSTRLAEAGAPRVRPALDALLRADLALKRSADERVVVERLVVELTGSPIARRPF